jgi:hypothetical protein
MEIKQEFCTPASREPQRGLTFDDVWAAPMKTQDRQEAFEKAFDKALEKSSADFDRRIKKLDQIIGRLGSRLGEVIECLMTPNLHHKFSKLGYTFGAMCRNKVFRDEKKQFLAEVDMFLENDKYAMAVEVKTNLGSSDIKEHALRMATIRHYADAAGDGRIFLGAVAAPKVDESVRIAAHRAGFFVIEPSEESVQIIVPEGFKPKEW